MTPIKQLTQEQELELTKIRSKVDLPDYIEKVKESLEKTTFSPKMKEITLSITINHRESLYLLSL